MKGNVSQIKKSLLHCKCCLRRGWRGFEQEWLQFLAVVRANIPEHRITAMGTQARDHHPQYTQTDSPGTHPPTPYIYTGILVPWLQRAGPGLVRAQQSFWTMNTMAIRQQLSKAVGCVSAFPKVLTQYLSRPVGVLTTGWPEQPVRSSLRSYQTGGRSRPNKQVNKHGVQSTLATVVGRMRTLGTLRSRDWVSWGQMYRIVSD